MESTKQLLVGEGFRFRPYDDQLHIYTKKRLAIEAAQSVPLTAEERAELEQDIEYFGDSFGITIINDSFRVAVNYVNGALESATAMYMQREFAAYGRCNGTDRFNFSVRAEYEWQDATWVLGDLRKIYKTTPGAKPEQTVFKDFVEAAKRGHLEALNARAAIIGA